MITCGSQVRASPDAASKLADEAVRVVDMLKIDSIDGAEVKTGAWTSGILTVEEHYVLGGLGSAVADVLVDMPWVKVPQTWHTEHICRS